MTTSREVRAEYDGSVGREVCLTVDHGGRTFLSVTISRGEARRLARRLLGLSRMKGGKSRPWTLSPGKNAAS